MIKFAGKEAGKAISNIAMAKLEKSRVGLPYSNNYLNDYYTNDPQLLKELKGKTQWNHLDKSPDVTKTLEYYSKAGRKVKVLGAVKKAGNLLDIFSIFKFATSDDPTSEPLSVPLGPLSPIVDLAGVMVQEQKAEMDQLLEASVQQEVDAAKLQGLEATRKEINIWNHDKEYQWKLMAISNETANKLVQGEFRTFYELKNDVSSKREDINDNIELLYRKTYNENKGDYIYIIESIFFNE